MVGSESAHAGGGAHDLLRQATQAMMSSSNKHLTDDDNVDHIGSDTPRSGIATPVPDPSDKRFPGISTDNYFNQVGTNSVKISTYNGPLETPALEDTRAAPIPSHQREKFLGGQARDSVVRSSDENTPQAAGNSVSEAPTLSIAEEPESSSVPATATPQLWSLHPYPTPPTSGPPSLHNLMIHDSKDEVDGSHNSLHRAVPRVYGAGHKKSLSEPGTPHTRRTSVMTPLSNVVTVSNVHASDFSNPSDSTGTSRSATPLNSSHAALSSNVSASASYEKLQKLTDDAVSPRKKSTPGTPTRALSNQTNSSNDSGSRPVTSTLGQVASQATQSADEAVSKGVRGKLTVKIIEARGIRRSKDPYVVAIFQRNELVSKGPHTEDDDDEDDDRPAIPSHHTGGNPMSRQNSEIGRYSSMAIPMKSRQSSSTSLTDYREFKKKKSRAQSFTDPRWDTEAVYDVVGDDSHINISVYDRGSTKDDFLGMVDFDPEISAAVPTPIHGWFPLQSRKDTTTPSGEIYVEITFQRTEKRHYGPDDFAILKLIGKGTFGQVYQVRKKDTKRIYAMKVLQKKVIVQKKEVAHTVGERNILVRTAMTESPFIVGLKFSFQTPTDLYLVTDYMSGGELFWHLQKEGRFDEKRAKFYIAELILALQHLHAHDIVYRDLKPENILLDANGHIALCDFGLSKANLTKNDTTNTFCGTTEYLAPEVLLDEAGYTKMVDFWSLGVLVFEMCCGWSPFYAEDTQQMYKNIAFGKVRFPRDTLTTEGRNFVKGLLNRNPKHRLGAIDDAEELKAHAFFADIDWEALIKKQISPPFKPKLKSETDVSNFDPEFTNALNGASSLNARAAALAAGIATSTPLSPGMQANFKGFTFVDENSIDEHMRDRIRTDYDDMDEDERREDEESVVTGGRNRDDRMSGIQKTTTNEDQNMFDGGHFDL